MALGPSASVIDHLFLTLLNPTIVYFARIVVSLSATEVSATHQHHQTFLVITAEGISW